MQNQPISTDYQGLSFVPGAINGVFIERGKKILAIYGDPRDNPSPVDMVLLTHFRRDVLWAAKELIEKGARAIVPAGEVEFFSNPQAFWTKYTKARYHDYKQLSTKVSTAALPFTQTVSGGDAVSWEDISIRVLDTPGYTRGSISFLADISGKKVCFCGDLLYGDGMLFDLYSLQDAIPDLGVDGYHGFSARLGQLKASLLRIAEEKPDLLIPCRGPVITDPAGAIHNLIARIQSFYANYLSMTALRAFFGNTQFLAMARRVLPETNRISWGVTGAEASFPEWIIPIDNSRLILSKDGFGFLVDAGIGNHVNKLKELQSAGTLKSMDQVFITHYHDDHVHELPAILKEFPSTVHATEELRDILENPSFYRMPCLSENNIHVTQTAVNGQPWKWKEFELTAYYFPGQTLYHDALLVKKDTGETVLFAGDSFTATGIDDYCAQNRNFLGSGQGLLFCLDLLKQIAPDALIINQHLLTGFRFTPTQIDRMIQILEDRFVILEELLPWDDPNFGLDEGWARFYPYEIHPQKGVPFSCNIQITNHSPSMQNFCIQLHLPKGWKDISGLQNVQIPPHEDGSIQVKIEPPQNVAVGLHVLTADIQWGQWDLREWCELLVIFQSDL